MKKLFSLLVWIFSFNTLLSNPIVIPQALISELTFDQKNNWILEITFEYSQPYHKQNFDSICVETINGFSRIRLENVKDGTELFVITSDSLMTPMSINKDGDMIKLHSFISEYYPEDLVDSLFFGNYPNSIIDSLQSGYSITRIFYTIYSKDKTPTIGFPNDTSGTCGTIHGYLYDKNHNPVTGGNFILDNQISLQNDGFFTTKVYSRISTYKDMLQEFASGSYHSVKIDSIKLNINPDFIYEKDIYILSDLIVGVKEKMYSVDNDIEIMNFPNPFNSSTTFKIKVPERLKNRPSQISIYNNLGKRIHVIELRNSSEVIWDGKDFSGISVSSGVYYYQLNISNLIYKTGSMIILK